MTDPVDASSPYLQGAPLLALAGWSPLPLPARAKKSPPQGFTGADGSMPSVADVSGWLVSAPGGNVAVRLPLDVVGIDVDAYGDKPGWQTFATLLEAHGPLPATWVVSARDDGRSGIRLFRLPPGADQATFRTGWPGIEVIRFGHRYVVAPPSIHPDTGTPYRCCCEETGESLDTLPRVDNLPLLPESWLAALARPLRAGRDRVFAPLPGPSSADPYAPCGAMATRLAAALGEMGAGAARHDVATSGALALVRLDEMGHHGGAYALDTLGRDFVARITGDRATRAQAVGEWRDIVESARARVAESPTPEHDRGCCGPDSAAARARAQGDAWQQSLGTVDVTAVDEPEPDAEPEPERTSWWPRDLTGALSGIDTEPVPTHLRRADGIALLYAGRVNGLIGESESGKTWVALLAVHQALRDGLSVLYLDFEDTPIGIVARLRSMGATDDEMAHLTYVGPDEALSHLARQDLHETLSATLPSLIVVDGVNAAMTLMGLDLMSNEDATTFALRLLRPLAQFCGSCVVYVDHVPKNPEQRAKGGIGAQAKRAMTTGCALLVEVVQPFGRGGTGRLRLLIDKDRPGHVRAAAVAARHAGDVTLGSDTLTGAVAMVIGESGAMPVVEGKARPTHRMQEVSRLLRSVDGAISNNEVQTAVGGNANVNRLALETLAAEGYIARETGLRNAVMNRHLRPYDEDRDPVLNPVDDDD